MKVTRFHDKVTTSLVAIVAVIILLIPFHAFLTVSLANTFGHYTLLRLWKEGLLAILLLGIVYLFWKEPKLRWKLISYKLSWLIAGYILVQLIWGIIALCLHHVDAKAVGYAWIINLRFLLFFLLVWVLALHVPTMVKQWPKWVIWPAAVVVLFGLLQYFALPYDFLKHVGYNAKTIYPYETINHNIHNIRIMSTLRGANPLGAYLVVILSLTALLWRKHKKSWLYAVLLLAGVITLVLTFSRSAWIGFIVSLGVFVWASLKTPHARRQAAAGVAVCVLVAGALFLGLRHNTSFQDALLHTDDHSTVATSSNQGHASALKNGVMDLLREPLGRGPGTAGPASAYNNHPVRIAENYFVQIGQETGWIGLLLFVFINIVVGRALWRRRNQTLALGLFAALIGLTVVNMLSHAWADDTLAYFWWGLAALSIATELDVKDEA